MNRKEVQASILVYGSVRKAAAALGVPKSTLGDISTGKTSGAKLPTLAALTTGYSKAGKTTIKDIRTIASGLERLSPLHQKAILSGKDANGKTIPKKELEQVRGQNLVKAFKKQESQKYQPNNDVVQQWLRENAFGSK